MAVGRDGFLRWRAYGPIRRQAYRASQREDAESIRILPTPYPRKPFCMRFLNIAGAIGEPMFAYDNSVQNVLHALHKRVYYPFVKWEPTLRTAGVVKRASSMLAVTLPEPMTLEEAAEHMRGNFTKAKAEGYIAGMHTTPFLRKHARGRSFVKYDPEFVKMGRAFDQDATFGDPRLIQARDRVFTGHLYPLYKRFEHAFYHGRYLFNPYDEYTCAKGFNLFDRMAVITAKVASLGGHCLCISLDGKRFDAHVCVEALKLEWRFVLAACTRSRRYTRSQLSELAYYGRLQFTNSYTAFANDGAVRYRVDGGRMSGDLNTGCGNSILQSIYIASTMAALKIPFRAWRMFVDGDDAFILLDPAYRSQSTRIPTVLKGFNQEVTISYDDVDLDHMEKLEFCRGRPVKVNGQWRLTRNPARAISRSLSCRRWFRSRKLAIENLVPNAAAGLIVNSDVPIMDAFMRVFALPGVDINRIKDNWWRKQARTSELAQEKSIGVQYSTRCSFERAWGITVSQQISLENSFPTPDQVLALLSSLDE